MRELRAYLQRRSLFCESEGYLHYSELRCRRGTVWKAYLQIGSGCPWGDRSSGNRRFGEVCSPVRGGMHEEGSQIPDYDSWRFQGVKNRGRCQEAGNGYFEEFDGLGRTSKISAQVQLSNSRSQLHGRVRSKPHRHPFRWRRPVFCFFYS